MKPGPVDGTLTAQQENFCRRTVEWGNVARAYRDSFNVAPGTRSWDVWRAASRLKTEAHIQRRIDELNAAALEQSLANTTARMNELRAMETANLADVQHQRFAACRHCHGVGHAYQWKDPAEFEAACADAVATAGKNPPKLPNCDGGFGYDPLQGPHPTCTECFGVGSPYLYQMAREDMTEAQAACIAGMKNGLYLFVDQTKIRDQLSRMTGAYKDAVTLNQPTQVASDAAPGDAGKSYLQMVHSRR